MDARGGKLLEFLRENNHLDLEVPDIAFSVKKSEKTVEAALLKLQQKGLVTARQNEYGRVYWYALPSAPITRTFKLDELKEIKEEFVNRKSEMEDEEVDLSELQSKSASKPVAKPLRKSKKSIPVSENEPEKESIVGPALLKKEIPPVSEPKVDKETEVPLSLSSVDVEEEFSADVIEPEGKMTTSTLTLPVLIIVGLISLGALVRGCGADGKIAAVQKSLPQNILTADDLIPLKSQIAAVNDLQKKIEALSSTVDSLKIELEKEKSKPVAVPPVTHKKPRRRKR